MILYFKFIFYNIQEKDYIKSILQKLILFLEQLYQTCYVVLFYRDTFIFIIQKNSKYHRFNISSPLDCPIIEKNLVTIAIFCISINIFKTQLVIINFLKNLFIVPYLLIYLTI